MHLALIHLSILVLALIAIALTFGVVWRTEKKLDICYKYLLLAIIMFGLGKLVEVLASFEIIKVGSWKKITEVLFIIFFTKGIWETRRMLQEMDGEIKKLKKVD